MQLDKRTQFGPYTIDRKLSKGATSSIYQAHTYDGKRTVAIKVSSENRFGFNNNIIIRREASLLSQLDYRGLVSLYTIPIKGAKQPLYMAREINIPDKPWYYAMEYLSGGSLADLLKQYKIFSLELASLVALKTLETLSYLRSMNLAHSDIKSENIIFRHGLKKGGEVDPVLIDFGMAINMKQKNIFGGTLVTMSPEVVMINKGLHPPEHVINFLKSDMYSLGVVMYRMITGALPFGGKSPNSITTQILHDDVIPPSKLNNDLPTSVDKLLNSLLAKNPNERPGIRKLKRQLLRLSNGVTESPRSFELQ